MPVDFTFPQLNTDQLTTGTDPLRNAANAAADLVCDLYKNYPSGIVPSVGDPTGVGSFTNKLLDDLCHPRNKFPASPPAKPFNGGQCPVLYNCSGTWTQDASSGSFNGGNHYGPIVNYRVVVDPQFPNETDVICDFAPGTVNEQLNARVATVGFMSGSTIATVVFTPTRVDGLADNCGSPAPNYPPSSPPPAAYQRPAPITIYNTPITVPVSITPTLIDNNFEFKPEINVRVGPINVNISLGGVTVNLGGGGGGTTVLPPSDTRPAPPPAIAPRSPLQPCASPAAAAAILCRVARLQKDLLDDGYDFIYTSYPAADSRKIEAIADILVRVELSLVNSLAPRYSEYGNANGVDAYYCGWFSFRINSKGYPRTQIPYADSVFLAPAGALGFNFTGTHGAQFTCTVVTKRRRSYVDNC